jgi:hypothetical protein
MTLPLSTYSESRSIAAGERAQTSMFLSRHCIGGLVSKRSLVGSNLSETQAKQFFKKPMKFTFGASGTVQIVDFAACTATAKTDKDAEEIRGRAARAARPSFMPIPAAVSARGRDGTG